MAGPIDFSDPAALNALFPGRFADPNAGPPSVTGAPQFTLPGGLALPPDIAAKLGPAPAPPIAPNIPAPELRGLPPLPPSIAGKFAAPPPDQTAQVVDNTNEPSLADQLRAKQPQPAPKRGAAPAQ